MIISQIIGLVCIGIVLLIGAWLMSLRRVVEPNMVHIIQRRNKTVSYGSGQAAGNVYYAIPSWVPIFGITKRELPVSNFDITINSFRAYDKFRLKFMVDLLAFFRIENTNEAAKKVENFQELKEQLVGIIQGAVRSILANSELETVLSERQIYADKFTEAVSGQLQAWGVVTVKPLELLDVRDGEDSNVIENIQKKKASEVEKEARVEIAQNKKLAEIAEIEAEQAVKLSEQAQLEMVGQREAEVEQKVGIAKQKAQQEIQEEAKKTADKEMEVTRVKEVKSAEISKQATIIESEKQKQVVVITAEAQLEAQKKESEKIKIESEAKLVAKQNEASGIKAEGDARAEAEKQMQMARVTSETALAEQIGSNKFYQEYLVNIKKAEISGEVGKANAKALEKADIKILSNNGDVAGSINGVSKMFSGQGGSNLGQMLEAFVQTPAGKALMEKFLGGNVVEEK